MTDERDQREFAAERKGVARGAGAAAAVTLAVAAAIWLLPNVLVLDAGLQGRLRLGAIASMIPALAVAAFVARIASQRFASPDSISGAAWDGPASQVSLAKALLANTVEQAVIAMPTYLLLALVLPAAHLVAVPALAGLFAAGRTLFAARYKSGAAARSFGFALTFYPTVAGMFTAALILVL